MAFITFQHKNTIDSNLKKSIMASGSGGEYVHCEIVLNNYGGSICSSWWPMGVEIRKPIIRKNPQLWVNYDLGDVDMLIYNYFFDRVGTAYTLPGLFLNMILNSNIKSTKSFCSQICYDALRSTKKFDLPKVISTSISPQDLKYILDKHNFNKLQQWH
jgi:hypothetical protein